MLSNNKEKEYQKFLCDKKISLTRMMCLLSILLFASFSIVDIWAIPSAFHAVLIIRAMAIFALITTYFLTFKPCFFSKNYNVIMVVNYVVATLAIEAMVYLSSPADQAYETYFVGVILILITLFSWTYLKLSVSIPLALFSILIYVQVEFIHRGAIENQRIPALITNIFLLVSAAIIGFVAQVIRDSYLKENFFLQQSLSSALEEKTEEAKHNEYKANHDELTGLPNRRYITELLEHSLDTAKEEDKILLILFIDLNGFKQINDIYGHAAGDEVLSIVARRLELAIRKSDNLSRLGGDEFLVGLLIEKEHLNGVEAMVDKYEKIISAPMNVEGQRLKVGASIGMAAFPVHGNKVSVLMDIADKKMYQVKHGKVTLGIEQSDDSEPVVIFPGNLRQK